MSKKDTWWHEYDGWTVQNCCGREPWLVISYFHEIKQEVILHFEHVWEKGAWRRERRAGNFKIVKVKLVEVK